MMVQAEQQVEDSDEGENSALLSPQPSTNNTPVRVTRTGTLLDSTEVFVPETPSNGTRLAHIFWNIMIVNPKGSLTRKFLCNMVIMKTVMTLNVFIEYCCIIDCTEIFFSCCIIDNEDICVDSLAVV